MLYTEEIFNELKSKVMEGSKNRPSFYRKGQYVYNTVYLHLGRLEPTIKAFGDSSVDCYYRDDKIEDFWNALNNEIIGNNYE